MSTTNRIPAFVPITILAPMLLLPAWEPQTLGVRAIAVLVAVLAGWQPWLRRRAVKP